MKKVIITLLALSAAYRGMSQGQAPTDTVKILMGNEYLTLPLPKDGHKVTINFEDSASITQVSIGRTLKGKGTMSGFAKDNVVLSKKEEKKLRRQISWFNSIEFGTVGMLGKNSRVSTDTAYSAFYSSNFNNITTDRVKTIKFAPDKIYSGISLGLTIREKRRKLGNTNYVFVSGSRFRYSMFKVKGQYENTEIKATYNNGRMTYHYDSIYSKSMGEYKSTVNMYQLVLPFLFETKSSKKNYTFSAGLNLVMNVNSSKIETLSGENLKTGNLFIVGYFKNAFLQIQPQIKFEIKRWSINMYTSMNRANIGYGAAKNISGRVSYLTIGYKLY